MLNSRPGLIRWTLAAICVGLASLAVTWGTGAAAQGSQAATGRRAAVTAIVHCVYYTAPVAGAFRTELRGVELSHDVDPGLDVGGPCSLAISQLTAQGFELAGSTSVAGDFNNDGAVDAADYVVWRKSLGQ